MPIWLQNDDPLGSAPLSTAVAALPVLTLFWLASIVGLIVMLYAFVMPWIVPG